MDKFIIALPRGNSQSKQKSLKRHRRESTDDKLFSKVVKREPNRSHVIQSFLDLGQQTFGAHVNCPSCDMLYVIGDVEDEARHKLFCVTSKRALSLSNMKGFHVVENGSLKNENDCIVELRMREKHKLEQEPLRTIIDAVQQELGSTLTLMANNSESILLYTRNKKVIGCIVREAVDSKELISLSLKQSTTDVNVKLKVENDTISYAAQFQESDLSSFKISTSHRINSPLKEDNDCADDVSRPDGVTMGIKLIWVFQDNRREGIATALLDSARKSFEFGRIIRKEHMAYSQPTESGLKLFLAYSNQNQIWGYC